VRHVAARLITQDYLFYRIESNALQAVLLRSFSALALAPVVLRHRERAFLSPAELSAITDAVASYAGREHIFTGYHSEYG